MLELEGRCRFHCCSDFPFIGDLPYNLGLCKAMTPVGVQDDEWLPVVFQRCCHDYSGFGEENFFLLLPIAMTITTGVDLFTQFTFTPA